MLFHHQELLPLRSDLYFVSRPIERAWRRTGVVRGKGERKRESPTQGSLDEAKRGPNWPPQELSYEVVLPTWGGPSPRDSGGRPLREHTIYSKRPIEAKDIAVGIVACNRRKLAVQKPSQPEAASTSRADHALAPPPGVVPFEILLSRSDLFRFEAHRKGAASSWELAAKRRCNKPEASQRRLPVPVVAVTLQSRRASARPQILNNIFVRPIIVKEHFAAVRRLSAK